VVHVYRLLCLAALDQLNHYLDALPADNPVIEVVIKPAEQYVWPGKQSTQTSCWLKDLKSFSHAKTVSINLPARSSLNGVSAYAQYIGL